MAKVKKLQENGVDIIPVTHESIVFDDNGLSIPEKYQTINDAIHIKDFDGYIDDVEIGGISKRQQVNVMSFGAKGDGVTDDTESIQLAIDYAYANNISKIIIPEGEYIISNDTNNRATSGILVKSNQEITMTKNTILRYKSTTSEYYNLFNLNNVVNVKITGGKLIGDRDAHMSDTGEWGMGIQIYESRNIIIDNVDICDMWGDCIYIGGNNYSNDPLENGIEPCDITICNCTLNNSRRQGISIVYGNEINIENCDILNINGTLPEYGIDIETSNINIPCRNIRVNNCYFEGSVGGGFVSGSSTENLIVTNSIFNNNIVNLQRLTNGEISNNIFNGKGCSIRNSSDVIISTNNFINSGLNMDHNSGNNEKTSNINIVNNNFNNVDNNEDKKAITTSGTNTDNSIRYILISNNTFSNFISETIYIYTKVNDLIISNNTINTNKVARYLLFTSIGCENTQIKNNNILAELSEIAGNTLLMLNSINLVVSDNTFITLNNNTDSIMAVMSGDCVMVNNIFKGTVNGRCIKTGTEGPYYILNNFVLNGATTMGLIRGTYYLKNNIFNNSEFDV